MTKMTRTAALLLLSGLLALPACDEGGEVPTEAACPSPSEAVDPDQEMVHGNVAFTPPEDPIDRDLNPTIEVRGAVFHDLGLTIRNVFVAGVQATKQKFNHAAWRVTLDYDNLSQLPVLAGGADNVDRVLVSAVAVDACGLEYSFAAFTLPIDLTPGLRVDALSLTVAMPPGLPDGREYLPADGSAAAVLTVTGGPKASGAKVALDATNGIFQGATSSAAGDVVTLAGEAAAAQATVLYFPTAAGLVLVSARAEDQLATAVISVAGPPTIVPSTAQLAPGQKLQLLAFSDGVVERCVAQPTFGVSITSPGPSGPIDLMFQPAAFDTNGDGRAELDVAIAEDLAEDVTVGITCFDVFDQHSSAQLTVVAAPPDEPVDPPRNP